MQILKPYDERGWITAIVEGRWIIAKVFNVPSTYGINNGMVSKLAVSKTSARDPSKNFHGQMCYNYDRGLDFDRAPIGLVNKIVAQLEQLVLKEKEESDEDRA